MLNFANWANSHAADHHASVRVRAHPSHDAEKVSGWAAACGVAERSLAYGGPKSHRNRYVLPLCWQILADDAAGSAQHQKGCKVHDVCKRALNGKRILLTGASSGIGWYMATQLVRCGALVIATARRPERLKQLRLAVGNPTRRLIALAGDVAEPAHREQLVGAATDHFGGLDLLIHNAGIGAVGPFEEASPERLRRIFEVDFFAVAELTRLALPLLRRGVDPAICVISSVLAHRGVPRKSEYCAAKFALRGWAEAVRLELKPAGIDLNTVSPSTTQSEFFDVLLETRPDQRSASFGSMPAEVVARATLRAIRQNKRELILSPGGKGLVWLSRLAPGLADRLLLRFAA